MTSKSRLPFREEYLKDLIDSMPAALMVVDGESRTILDANRTAATLFGAPRDEIIGKVCHNFICSGEEGKCPIMDCGLSVDNAERLLLTADGSRRPVLKTVHPLRLPDRTLLLETFIDISDRKTVEDSLLRERDRTQQFLDVADIMIVALDKNGLVILINKKGCSVLGCREEEVVGRNWFDNFLPPNSVPVVKSLFAEIIAGKSGLKDSYENTILTRSGEERLIAWHNTLLTDERGNITGTLSSGEDITYRKFMEIKLRQAYKMEAMGILAGGIAHEFNNILTAILGFADLAMEGMPEESQARKDLNEVLRASNRARDLVSQILSFSRQAEQQLQAVQIQPLIKEGLKLLRASTPSTIEILQDITSEDTTVRADPAQVHQILMNLCTNAIHALKDEKGTITVRLARLQIHEKAMATGNLPPGGYIELSVRDSGGGIDESIINRIFDPFFTTKDVDRGTGMGLSVVHSIVESYQGAVTVESRVGEGSAFHVFFPAAEEEEEATILDHEPVPTGSERVLFVDDETVLVQMGKQMLERLGYAVTATTDSAEALEIFKAQPERFDLVITDQTMPNLTGEELAEIILAIRPEMPIILSSGYSTMIDEAKAKGAGIREFILKPIEKIQLAKTIRKVLEQK